MFTNKNNHTNHTFFMELALAQAQKNLGNTKENPSVGCVLVKNGHLISAGNTGEGGRPHAEQNAINFSKINLQKSELYVTLEPCSHYGKTPPCVKTIIRNKIKRVFFSKFHNLYVKHYNTNNKQKGHNVVKDLNKFFVCCKSSKKLS